MPSIAINTTTADFKELTDEQRTIYELIVSSEPISRYTTFNKRVSVIKHSKYMYLHYVTWFDGKTLTYDYRLSYSISHIDIQQSDF